MFTVCERLTPIRRRRYLLCTIFRGSGDRPEYDYSNSSSHALDVFGIIYPQGVVPRHEVKGMLSII